MLFVWENYYRQTDRQTDKQTNRQSDLMPVSFDAKNIKLIVSTERLYSKGI